MVLKLEFFINCSIKFILIYLQFICNINRQRTDNKIKIFYSKKINICEVIFNKSIGTWGLWVVDLSSYLTSIGSSTMFLTITISWFLSLSTISSTYFCLTSSSSFWQVISSIFNSRTCCKSQSFLTTSKFSLKIGYFFLTLKPFPLLDIWTWLW